MPTSARGCELRLVQPWCNQQCGALLRSRRPIVRTHDYCVRILCTALEHCNLRTATLLLLRVARVPEGVPLWCEEQFGFALAVGKLCPIDERTNRRDRIDQVGEI
jgi:hypothetical protein